jgi:hypothetical protein
MSLRRDDRNEEYRLSGGILDFRFPQRADQARQCLPNGCLELAAYLITRDEVPTSIERGGRKAHAMHLASYG